MKTLIAVALVATLTACGGGSDSADETGVVRIEPSGATDATLAYRLSLRAKAPVHVAAEQLTVSLQDVVDSRCPAGVTCVAAGAATVKLDVALPGVVPETAHIELSLDAAKPAADSAKLRDYRLVLRALSPMPPAAGAQLSDYTATVELQKLKSSST